MTKQNKHRNASLRSVHRLYRRCEAGLEGRCVYCGKYADTMDHIPPVSVAVNLNRIYLKELDPVLVPACRHCNSVIGASEQVKLVDRRDIVAQHITTKKKRMFERGKKLSRLSFSSHHDFRDAACINLFERWQFASISQNEVEDPDPIEEVYERDDFSSDIDRPDLTAYQLLSSWGMSDVLIDTIGHLLINEQQEVVAQFSYRDQKLFKIYQTVQPMRGPFNWLKSWEEFGTQLTERFSETIDPEVVALKFQKVQTAKQAFVAINQLLIDFGEIGRKDAILSFRTLKIESEVADVVANKSKVELQTQLEIFRKYLRSLPAENRSKQLKNISPDLWPFEKTQTTVENKFNKFIEEIQIIANEYKFAKNELKNMDDFQNFLEDLPSEVNKSILSECNTHEVYLILLLHIELLGRTSEFSFLNIRINQ